MSGVRISHEWEKAWVICGGLLQIFEIVSNVNLIGVVRVLNIIDLQAELILMRVPGTGMIRICLKLIMKA